MQGSRHGPKLPQLEAEGLGGGLVTAPCAQPARNSPLSGSCPRLHPAPRLSAGPKLGGLHV